MIAQNIVFWILALAMVVAGYRMVRTQNVVRAALFLAVVLAGGAAQYLLLAAEFVAWVQVLVYIGAVVVLVLFAVMLTRAPVGTEARLDNDQKALAAGVALLVLGVLSAVLWDGFGQTELAFGEVRPTAELADTLFGRYVLPFEVVSVLLLAAVIGAVAMARRD